MQYGHAGGGVNRKRANIAVINNHSSSILSTDNDELFKHIKPELYYSKPIKELVWKMKLNKIGKMVFDVSTDSKIRELIKNGLIIKKGKSKKEEESGNISKFSGRVSGYATKSLELLAYGQIPQTDIVGVLTPMEADMLFPQACSVNVHNIETQINNVINKPFCWEDYIDNYLEYQLLSDVYESETKNLHDIVYEIYLENRGVDILSLYSFLNNTKKVALAKIYERKYGILPIINGLSVEDKLYAMVVGDYYKMASKLVDYKGNEFVVDPLPINQNKTTINLSRDISLLIDYRDNMLGRIKHDDVYVLNGKEVSKIEISHKASVKDDINEVKPLIKSKSLVIKK